MAVVITYATPVAGTVAPTSDVAKRSPALSATITWADADTAASVVHNWKLSTAELAALQPFVIVNLSPSTTTVVPVLSVALTDSSTVTIGKGTVVGTQGTLTVVLLRPFSMLGGVTGPVNN